ncbi:unnamed protein product, partial [Rotaria sordida]
MTSNNNSTVNIQLSNLGENYHESDSDDSELDEPQQPRPTVEEQIDP